ncbi:uncharacterized protein LOC116177425 [Photinus pyralis]|nr:uncharacterized protein LOC116177425 [Photinus pyralis]
MRFFAVFIGILIVHCTFGRQCQQRISETLDNCMKIIYPAHSELFRNTPYMPQLCFKGKRTPPQVVREQLNERRNSNQQSVKYLLDRLDDISRDHTRKITSVDSSVQERFIGVLTPFKNVVLRVQKCVEKPNSSCEEIQMCCSDVKRKEDAQSSVSLPNLKSLFIERNTEFDKICKSTMNSIRDLQRDLNSTFGFI